MDCKKVKEELVFRFTDNELGQELTIALGRHVEVCPTCAHSIRMARLLLTALRERVPPTPAPKRLRVRILTAIRRPLQ
jgi:hypothetical protein